MHPHFSSIFTHPESHKKLHYLGETQGDKWSNGFLWAEDEEDLYPVVNGIPIFTPPFDRTEAELKKSREEHPSRSHGDNPWKTSEMWLKEEGGVAEFIERIAESGGLVLDVASGHGGGLIPSVLHLNPEVTYLMNEIQLWLLQEWQAFLQSKDITNTSFALFDARKMPLQSNSIDLVSDAAGINNIPEETDRAAQETYRILKPGGTLYSLNLIFDRDRIKELPKEVWQSWYRYSPMLLDGLVGTFKQAGFEIASHTFVSEQERHPEDGDLSRKADQYGVKLKTCLFCTEAVKRE